MRSLIHSTDVKNSISQSNNDPSKVVSRNLIAFSKAMLIDDESARTEG